MRSRIVAAALIAAVVVPGAAMGQRLKAACHVQSCSGVQPGGGRIVACLRAHKSQVTTPCLTALGRMFLNMHPHRHTTSAGSASA